MGTKVYGASDDLIEFDGDLHGEVSACSATEEAPLGNLLAFSDGTVLAVRYGKPAAGWVWAIDVLRKGSLFDRCEVKIGIGTGILVVAFFRDGALKAWHGRDAAAVK